MLLFVILGAKVIKRCKLCKKKQSIFRILMYLCAQHKVTLHMNIRMNIILSAGIIIARYGYDQMPPVLWLILNAQSLHLLFCFRSPFLRSYLKPVQFRKFIYRKIGIRLSFPIFLIGSEKTTQKKHTDI